MNRQLELAALGLAVVGWLCAILTRCLALWKVSGTLDNATATLPAYWDGVWLEWDHWDLNNDGSLHCSFYQSLMSLSGSFRTWRALIMSAIGAGAFATVIAAVGLVWFPKRGQVKVFSGGLFVLSGILLLVPTAWTCHHTSQPLEGAVLLRRDWGPALYLGWISFGLMVPTGRLTDYSFSSPSSTSFRLRTSREPRPLVSQRISSSISLKQPGSTRHT
uniref:Claudin n=1 Tax=Stegastes partitus TaxID=144197 RepID=A0A3B5AMS3_9TELE